MTSEVVDKIFHVYREHGSEGYIGEDVTQLEHATQCAMMAEKAGQSEEVILGAFLHDIGHLLPANENDHMFTDGLKLSVSGHEKRGEEFLEHCDVPEAISSIALGHVSAKRYLCYKDPVYHGNLSDASKKTLVHQGGPMTATEAVEFEKSKCFKINLQARVWDEAAKVPNMTIDPLSKYEEMLRRVLAK